MQELNELLTDVTSNSDSSENSENDADGEAYIPLEMNEADEAAKHGNIYLLAHYWYQWSVDTMLHAVCSNQLETVQYLHKNKCPWSDLCASQAAYHGYIDILRYLIDNGCPTSYLVANDATVRGQLACLRYAVDHGCEVVPLVVMHACQYNRIDCLQYLLSECNALYDMNAILICCQRANLVALKMLLASHAFVFNEDEWRPQTYAANNGHLIILKYLHEELKLSLSSYILQHCVARDRLQCAQYVTEVVSITSSEMLAALKMAVESKATKCILFLVSYSSSWYPGFVADVVMKHYNVEVCEYLFYDCERIFYELTEKEQAMLLGFFDRYPTMIPMTNVKFRKRLFGISAHVLRNYFSLRYLVAKTRMNQKRVVDVLVQQTDLVKDVVEKCVGVFI